MAKYFLSSVVLFLYTLQAVAQCDFKVLGPDDYQQPSYYPVAAYVNNAVTGGDGELYIGYLATELANYKFVIKKYNGNQTWTVKATTESIAEMLYSPVFSVDANGIPYLMYNQGKSSGKPKVIKWENNTWSTVGTNDISTGDVYYNPCLSISGEGSPYVAYRDIDNGQKVTVKKLMNNNWVSVGTGVVSPLFGGDLSFTLAPDGTPYVLFNETNGYGTVKKFDGSDWITVGLAGFTGSVIRNYDLAIDHHGVPYVSFRLYQSGFNENGTVMKYDGSAWVDVGARGFTHAFPTQTKLGFDQNNTLSLAYCANQDIYMQQFNGTAWNIMGSINPSATPSRPWLVNDVDGNLTVIYLENVALWRLVAKTFKNGTWNMLGNYGISNSWAELVTLSINSQGVPYLAYEEANQYSHGVSMKRFVNGQWEYVGDPLISGTDASGFSAALDRSGVPYVVTYSFEKTTVRKFDGTSWVPVGGIGSSDGRLDGQSLAFDLDNTPYLFYSDATQNFKSVVKKFDGTSWTILGTAGITGGYSYSKSTAVDANGILYIAYQDDFNGKASVMKYLNSSWSYVGPQGFSLTRADYPSMVLGNDGLPYVAYSDYVNGGKLTVKKFDGSDWVTVGVDGFSQGEAWMPSLAINADGVLSVAYKDMANNERATLMSYKNNSWTAVATAFSSGFANFPSLAINPVNNKPYVAFVTNAVYVYGFCPEIVTSLEPTNPPVKEAALGLFPNPNNGHFSVELAEGQTVFVVNAYGKVVLEKACTSGKQALNMSSQPNGLYFLKIGEGDNKQVIRFVKE